MKDYHQGLATIAFHNPQADWYGKEVHRAGALSTELRELKESKVI